MLLGNEDLSLLAEEHEGVGLGHVSKFKGLGLNAAEDAQNEFGVKVQVKDKGSRTARGLHERNKPSCSNSFETLRCK